MKAQELINALPTHSDLAGVPNRVVIILKVLDRLCDEVEFLRKKKRDRQNRQDEKNSDNIEIPCCKAC